MSGVLPIVCVARHCETTRSLSCHHAGLADLQCGERNALPLGFLKHIASAKVFTCALKRAARTFELAGFGDPEDRSRSRAMGLWPIRGSRTHEIHERRPQWRLLCDGCPEGETPSTIDWNRRPDYETTPDISQGVT
jgi:broad specificity phosphatase PhoE